MTYSGGSSHHYPYAEEPQENITYPSYTIKRIIDGPRILPNKTKEYKVQWKDFNKPSWEPFRLIKDSMALEKYLKKKKSN
jgi:hypothetical protein